VLSEGLRITLDAAPRADTVNTSTVIVKLEAPTAGELPSYGPYFSRELVIDGDVTVPAGEPNVILWMPKRQGQRISGILGIPAPREGDTYRVRVVVKGHFIWREDGGVRRYLDGQTFGIPARNADRSYRTGLLFPSGRGEQASDFDSWFWLSVPTAMP
jgi:hypothetical protein